MRPTRSDERRLAEIPARLTVDGGEPIIVLVTDVSRGGCRVEPTGDLPSARAMTIEVAGWPQLHGRTVWSRAGETGLIFDPKIDEDVYSRMLAVSE